MKYTATKNDEGKLLRELILRDIGLSRAFLKHLKFTENGICVNGRQVTVRYPLREGDEVSLATEDRQAGSSLVATELPLEIIYEDGSLVVPSKPADMPTHPSRDHHGDTLADALAYRYSRSEAPFVFRPINRLDRNTSGLTLIAKDRISAARLSESMRKGEIKKQYLAILDGLLECDEGRIETHMRRSAESIIVREVCSAEEGGDLALTSYRVIFRNERCSLVLASPETGRTHQLRVHFAHLGAPILGDDMYGTPSHLICRQALHALKLSFPHPSDRRELALTAPLPEDMQSAIRELFAIDADKLGDII